MQPQPPDIPDMSQVTIIGTGLLGGSVGLALRATGFRGRIVGFGRRQATLDAALAGHCIDRIATDLADAAREADLVILATPVASISEYLKQLSPLVSPQAVITDVGSTKLRIVEAAEATLAHPGRFVGAHPMAGSEAHGPEAARADLFRHKPVILTPMPATDAAALALVEQVWQSLGMRLHHMTPAEHDQTVARISHLPHLAAVLLVRLAERGEGMRVASTGFASTTRVASGEPEVWADIFIENREAVLAVLDEWQSMLGDFRGLLEQGGRDDLLKLLRSAQQSRDSWIHGNGIEATR